MKLQIRSTGTTRQSKIRKHSNLPLWFATALVALTLLTMTAGPASQAATPVPVPLAQQSEPVYALPGRLRAVQDTAFATVLVTHDGIEFGLVGRTASTEQAINRLRDTTPQTEVKVWGTLYPAGRSTDRPEIIVDIVLAAAALIQTPTPTATATPDVPTATVVVNTVEVRAGPGLSYETVGGLIRNDACFIVGRDNATTWWQIRCTNGTLGWVPTNTVRVTGDLRGIPVVPVAPAPILTPTSTPVLPVGSGNWQATYFQNRDLSGSPALVENVPAINFDWGTDSPAPNLPSDNFSARFERGVLFSAGNYELRATVDDGVRVWLDDQLIIDDWRERSLRTLTVQRILSGNHYFRIEYFEAFGSAVLQFDYALVRSVPDWQASYFNNISLAGNPVLSRSEPRGQYPLDRNWGSGSPSGGIVNEDDWSARWVGTYYFESGDYIFGAESDDGVRIYIDGIRVVNAWSEGAKEVSNRFNGLGAGDHQITIEYFERSGLASLRTWWYRTGTTTGSSDSRDQ